MSRSLSSYIHNFVQSWFVGNHCRSNYLLRHFASETHLDLYLNGVIDHSALLKMTNLISLKIDHCSPIDNSYICQLSKLTKLYYVDKYANEAELGNLTNLKKLKLSFSLPLDDIDLEPPIFLTNLTNLTSLYLSYWDRKISIDAVTTLTNLTKLDIYHDSHFNDSIMRKLPQLKSLSLQSNYRDSIPDLSVNSLTQLTHFRFFSHSINDKYLFKLTNLLSLHIPRHRSITNRGIQNLTQLTRLNIKDTSKIDNNGLYHLTNLTDLNLARVGKNNNNKIENRGIQNLTSLKRLILSENQSITDEALWKLTNLTHLNLNFQEGITDNALKRLTQLTHLEIRANKKITDEGVSHLIALSHLNISSNLHISDRSLYRLTNLTTLDARNYEVDYGLHRIQTNTTLTDHSVKTLTTLSTLYISNNSMLSDRSVACLTNLTELICSNHQISPESLLRLPKLCLLNPLLKIDPESRTEYPFSFDY